MQPLGWQDSKSKMANMWVVPLGGLTSSQHGNVPVSLGPSASVSMTKVEVASETIWCHSHDCHHLPWLEVSHTCSHSRGVNTSTISQWEDRQGHVVEARVCEMKDILRLFLKVQSVAVFMVRIYYPVEDIFLATVCLAYLPLCIWELFRKKNIFICAQERNEITYSNNSDEKNKC